MISQIDDLLNEQTLDNIADALNLTGYIILNNAIELSLLNNLQNRMLQIPIEQWIQAGVGRKQAHQFNTNIRSDKISWITQNNQTEIDFLDIMELLRSGINKRLYLGLFDYESHFAIYPKGSFYQKHEDALKGKSNRILSTVVYLNDNWNKDNGGELLIYKDSKIVQSIIPYMGTVVIFLSEGNPHEVLKATRERHSIAGWFRLNASNSNFVDPSQ